MSKKPLLIFGNGLGMALDSDHFNLSNALKKVWNGARVLSDPDRRMIGSCINTEGVPRAENDLDLLQRVVSACQFLCNLETGDEHWLSDQGQKFPEIIATYIYRVSARLYAYDGMLPEAFLSPLLAYIRKQRPNVATLNYDKLLYQAFLDSEVCSGDYHTTALADGMIHCGFSEASLRRKFGNTYGYYMHLHGSPLFLDNGGNITKKNVSGVSSNYHGKIGRHVVLTHVDHKVSLIQSSNVLSVYWKLLDESLMDADQIVLFGYSGCDSHLNDLISLRKSGKQIRII